MCFGPKNVPATFNESCSSCSNLVNVDDIVVQLTYLQEYIDKFEVFERLAEAKFKIRLKKYHFLKKEIKYFCHILTDTKVKMNPSKQDAFKIYPLPKTVKGIRSFLGLF